MTSFYYSIVFVFILNLSVFWQVSDWAITYYPRAVYSHKYIGMELNKYKEGGYTLALGDAGLIPYHSEWNTIDLVGLGTIQVAHNGITTDFLRHESPDLFLLVSTSPNEGSFLDQAVSNDPCVINFVVGNEDYLFIPGPLMYDSYYLNAYLKKGIKDHDSILDAIIRSAAKSEVNKSLKNRDVLFQLIFN